MYEALATLLAEEAFLVVDATTADLKEALPLKTMHLPVVVAYKLSQSSRSRASRRSWLEANGTFVADDYMEYSSGMNAYLNRFAARIVGIPQRKWESMSRTVPKARADLRPSEKQPEPLLLTALSSAFTVFAMLKWLHRKAIGYQPMEEEIQQRDGAPRRPEPDGPAVQADDPDVDADLVAM